MGKMLIGIYLVICVSQYAFGLFEFPKVSPEISEDDARILSNFNESAYLEAIKLATDSVRQEERLERNLINANIRVTNGTVSHAQLLETLPNEQAQQYDRVAKLILKSSLYFLNSGCRNLGVDDSSCGKFLSKASIPQSELKDQCLRINNARRPHGSFAFRRLLPANYKDGLVKIYKEPNVPNPRRISLFGANSDQDSNEKMNDIEISSKNVALVQWAQFIEHDLSKSVVTTMQDGTAIECCDSDHAQLKPRHKHPACAPIKGISRGPYAREPCLNYVRSSLAVNPDCKFGPAEQLNQASNLLDLSQLYGFSAIAQNRMRTFRDGLLKTSLSGSSSSNMSFLPLAENSVKFCVNHAESCFMAGDSRVNSNPFMTLIYTMFLRSHNKIAERLKLHFLEWDDNRIYNEARRMNIELYRCIIYNEWLPAVVGSHIANAINQEPIPDYVPTSDQGVSNEFAVAAIRFYYSMMPDVLHGSQFSRQTMLDENVVDSGLSEKIFALKDHYFESEFISKPHKMDVVMEAMMQQRAMDMDSNYVEDLTSHYLQTEASLNKTSGIDALAWDIQRGRDHGIAGYVKYLEICVKTKINNWDDLARFINRDDLERLRSVYQSVEDIDLIVGGISEKKNRGAVLGPTFTCILGEQFSNSRRHHWYAEDVAGGKNFSHDRSSSDCPDMPSHSLLCMTTGLKSVPRNIFHTPSDTNPLIPCKNN